MINNPRANDDPARYEPPEWFYSWAKEEWGWIIDACDELLLTPDECQEFVSRSAIRVIENPEPSAMP